jgi:phosphoglycolate phosphatase
MVPRRSGRDGSRHSVLKERNMLRGQNSKPNSRRATEDRFTWQSIRLVMFDLAGTTVRDGSGGGSIVAEAFLSTFREAGIILAEEAVSSQRGKDKRDAIRALLIEARPTTPASEEEVDTLLVRFLSRLQDRLTEFEEIPGAADALRFLQRLGIRIGIGSGLPQEFVETILIRLGWLGEGLVDLAVSTERVGAGRPDPRMIHEAMAHFGIDDPHRVLKVGDTVSDIEEGRNAGTWTAAVVTGTQGEGRLRAASPDFILASVADVPTLFAKT